MNGSPLGFGPARSHIRCTTAGWVSRRACRSCLIRSPRSWSSIWSRKVPGGGVVCDEPWAYWGFATLDIMCMAWHSTRSEHESQHELGGGAEHDFSRGPRSIEAFWRGGG